MDDLTLVRTELHKIEYKDLDQVERATGVPAGTMAKIKCGVTKNPRYQTIAKLAGYFRRVIASREAIA